MCSNYLHQIHLTLFSHHLSLLSPSHMLGLTLHSRSNPFMFVPKAPSSIGPSSRIPIELLHLPPRDLNFYYNPHYHKLVRGKTTTMFLRCFPHALKVASQGLIGLTSCQVSSHSRHTPRCMASVPDKVFTELNFLALVLCGKD
jgi:hypothetical protein